MRQRNRSVASKPVSIGFDGFNKVPCAASTSAAVLVLAVRAGVILWLWRVGSQRRGAAPERSWLRRPETAVLAPGGAIHGAFYMLRKGARDMGIVRLVS